MSKKAIAERRLEVVYRDPFDLKPDPRNARTHSPEQIEQLRASIREFGFTNPVLLRPDGMIGAGHGRVEAAKAEKLNLVPTCVVEGLTAEQWRAYVLADNKLALNAGWDEDLLRAELAALQDLDLDLSSLGFDDAELADLFDDHQSAELDVGSTYSRKVTAPIYTPKGPAPSVDEMFDETKAQALRKEIAGADLPADVAAFLNAAADRHTVFNFHRIADYYANAPANIQRLMENSALVIIDFDRAIELGFVTLSSRLGDLASGEADEV